MYGRYRIAPSQRMMLVIEKLAEILKVHDDLNRERQKTASVAEKVFKTPRSEWRCALCGHNVPLAPRIAAAHIFPLEEGGQTEESNLIPLCEGALHISTAISKTLDWLSKQVIPKAVSFGQGLTVALGKDPEVIGCHKLLDYGLISRTAIRDVKNTRPKRRGYVEIRHAALNIPLDRLDTEFSPGTSRSRRITRLKRRVLQAFPSADERIVETCKLISAARRLVSPRYLSLAQKHCRHLQEFLRQHWSNISPANLSRFYYEHALLSMVQQPKPDLRQTIRSLEKSFRYARVGGEQSGWARSRLEWVHAQTFASSKITARQYARLMKAQEECIQILAPKRGGGDPDKIRWMMNSLMHRAQLQVKAGRINDARDSVQRARELRDHLNVATGWTQFQAVHLNAIEGAILAWTGEYERALRLLSRALIPMRATRGKRPEGYKDIAQSAAWVLKQMGRKEEARKVDYIARRMVDGRSGFWVPPAIIEKRAGLALR